MINHKRVLYLVSGFFPYGSAGASRAISFCKLLHQIGFATTVITPYSKTNYPNKYFKTTEFDCYITNEGVPTKRSVITGDTGISRLALKILSNNKFDAILLSAEPVVAEVMIKYGRKTGIPVYIEHCEWYDKTNFTFGFLDPRFIRMETAISRVYPKATGVIVISKLLEEYYSRKGCKTIRIPTILDLSNNLFGKKPREDDRIRLVYTGSPGKSKELLLPIISAILNNEKYQKRISFDVYGPSLEQVLENIGWDGNLLRRSTFFLSIHGRVSQEEISSIVSNSDYQIFVRPDRKSSNAGFPTKLGESFAVGTPVITNDTGDICEYLSNGFNGFLLNGTSAKDIEEVMDKLLLVDDEAYSRLCQNARKTAELYFDYKMYSHSLETFFN